MEGVLSFFSWRENSPTQNGPIQLRQIFSSEISDIIFQGTQGQICHVSVIIYTLA